LKKRIWLLGFFFIYIKPKLFIRDEDEHGNCHSERSEESSCI